MVRVAGVLDQIHHGRTSRDASGMTPTEVMDGLVEKIHEFAKKQYSCYNRSIIPSLRSAGIFCHFDISFAFSDVFLLLFFEFDI